MAAVISDASIDGMLTMVWIHKQEVISNVAIVYVLVSVACGSLFLKKGEVWVEVSSGV